MRTHLIVVATTTCTCFGAAEQDPWPFNTGNVSVLPRSTSAGARRWPWTSSCCGSDGYINNQQPPHHDGDDDFPTGYWDPDDPNNPEVVQDMIDDMLDWWEQFQQNHRRLEADMAGAETEPQGGRNDFPFQEGSLTSNNRRSMKWPTRSEVQSYEPLRLMANAFASKMASDLQRDLQALSELEDIYVQKNTVREILQRAVETEEPIRKSAVEDYLTKLDLEVADLQVQVARKLNSLFPAKMTKTLAARREHKADSEAGEAGGVAVASARGNDVVGNTAEKLTLNKPSLKELSPREASLKEPSRRDDPMPKLLTYDSLLKLAAQQHTGTHQ